jgi:hypothetical protein
MTKKESSTLGKSISRRDFVGVCVISAAGTLVAGPSPVDAGLLSPDSLLDGLVAEAGVTPIKGATWYRAGAEGGGIVYRFEPGMLLKGKYMTADILLDGKYQTVFELRFQEGEEGPTFRLGFALLNQCSARIRMPFTVVDQNRWRLEREAAWLKPLCGGDRVDLKNIDRMTLRVLRNGGKPSRWCLTPFSVAAEEVPRIERPILTAGPLLDELGQSRLHQWRGKSKTRGEVTDRLKKQFKEATSHKLPDGFTRYGGWKEQRFDSTGFFRAHHDGRRWWLVDPEGYAFWSAGMDCVRVDTMADYNGLETALAWLPDREGAFKDCFAQGEGRRTHTINYLTANMIRAFGEAWYDSWKVIALGELRRLGFNTVANWSDWRIARETGTPYVRPLAARFRTPTIYRDFPDVFSPSFQEDCDRFSEQLRETADDPALVGYFLMNEPTWGFSSELPAAGMLHNTASCQTRQELAAFLRQKYRDEAALCSAWQIDTTFAEVGQGKWSKPLRGEAMKDLRSFSGVMAGKFFSSLSEACRKVDPHHLNMGVRYHTVPPDWAMAGMESFDVFSMNCYRDTVPLKDTETISRSLKMPVIIGEWHFGALDAGLPASGIGHVRTQEDRGKAYRVYLEDAAANPYCVGAHWFTLYDQSALGRFDGENYNIGFLDVCNRPYLELGRAALASHRAMYSVAAGKQQPYGEAPEYLPKLFM